MIIGVPSARMSRSSARGALPPNSRSQRTRYVDISIATMSASGGFTAASVFTAC